MTYLEDYEALTTSGKPADEVFIGQIGIVREAVGEHPTEFFAELREKQPVFVTPIGTVVTHYQDVLEVMDLNEVFGVGPYGTAMIRNNDGLNFLLGREDGPDFEREKSLMKTVVRQADLEAIRVFVAERAAATITALAPDGRLDLAWEYAYHVPMEMAAWYFGTPIDDVTEMMAWCRAIFTDTFLNLAGDAAVTAAAGQAGVEFRAHVDRVIAAAHAGTSTPASAVYEGNVLQRLVALQGVDPGAFSDREIQNNLIGCIVGVSDNTEEAAIRAVHILLDRPEELPGAIAAAQADDTELVRKYIWEALRFHTPAPFLVRVATRAHTLAQGTPRETEIPAGAMVLAANSSAMMDATQVDDPMSFRLDRPKHHYMHFGWGMHECLGQHICAVQLPELVKGVLRLPGLRRATGEEGQPLFENSTAKRFIVEFDV